MAGPLTSLLRAVKHLSDGELPQAERAASEGLRLDRDNGRLRQIRGVCRHLLHCHREAIVDLETAEILIPLDPLGLWCLADSYARTSRDDLARDYIEWLVQRPDCPTTLLSKCCKLLARMGDNNLALHAYARWIDAEPASAAAHFGAARIQARLGYPLDCLLPNLQRAFNLEPTKVEYRASLGAAYAASGQPDAARLTMHSLRVNDVHCPHIASKFAAAMDQSGDTVAASAWWIRAIQLSGGSPA